MEQYSVNVRYHLASTRAQSRIIRGEKKICKIFTNKYIAKCFIPTRLNRVLNNLHALAARSSNSIQMADDLLQKIIKSGMKFQVLYSNNIILLNPNGIQLLMELCVKFNTIIEIIAALSTFNSMAGRLLLQYELSHCRELIHRIIGTYLTQNSHQRIDYIFNFISTGTFLRDIFDSELEGNHDIIVQITDDLHALMRNVIVRE
ncbi:unnamed protein product [Adineta steineri]|uniref:Uncharacterized protein n=1 Tax=Adineta steineri TaxID=433720 RepID=A0A819CNU5_9BILA|nr:unnamed protein product [Adineta steineri]CAF1193397.1 unnamed protein product [Adineta steineri]CAF3823125.1 unnamed protein product [Adineta steineri]CAF4105534.1 unnamed protein product [Adineta steineri]